MNVRARKALSRLLLFCCLTSGLERLRTNAFMADKPSDGSESRLKCSSEPFFCGSFSQAGSRFTIETIQSRIIGRRNRFFSIASVINLWPSKGSTSKK
jgi:hypothetical protein